MRKKAFFLLAVALAAVGCVAGILIGKNMVRSRPELAAPEASQALLQASRGLDVYEVEAVYDEKARTLLCTQRVVYQNRSQDDLDSVYFHLYPNAFKREETSPAVLSGGKDEFEPGEIFIEDVQVNGAACAWAVAGEDESALRVPAALAPGGQAQIELRYRVEIPKLAYRWGEANGVVSVANAFPIAAIYERGAWRLDEYGPVGDPFYSACANWTLSLTVPEGFVVSAGGAVREAETKDGQTWILAEALAARDMAFSMSRRYAQAQQRVGDVLISSYALRPKDAEAALEYAMSALEQLQTMLGAYPFPTLTLAQKDIGGYGGMEYSGFMLLDDSLYSGDRQLLERVVAHETAHQYFGMLAGSDQVEEPWMDEAFCEYMTLMYYDKEYGRQAFDALYAQRIEPALRITHPIGVTAGSAITSFTSGAEYVQLVYQKGAGMLHGIREALGEARFLEALRTYIDKYAFGIATREDFTVTMQEATGTSWRGFIDDYLDE